MWRSIRDKDGSVQHLDFLSEHENVFKTYSEIDQMDIIYQAATDKIILTKVNLLI